MAYTLPDFNLEGNVWLSPNKPLQDLPDLTLVPMQLYRNTRDMVSSNLALIRVPASYSTVAWASFVSDPNVNPWIECPAGSGSFFNINRALWAHRGFPNEYIQLHCSPYRVTYPPLNFTILASDTDLCD